MDNARDSKIFYAFSMRNNRTCGFYGRQNNIDTPFAFSYRSQPERECLSVIIEKNIKEFRS